MFSRSNKYLVDKSTSTVDRFLDHSGSGGTIDYTNSELLYSIDQLALDRHDWTITKYENRIDLLSREIYGSEEYSWLLLYINRVNIEDLEKGKVIQYIDKDQLDGLMSRL